MAWRWYVVREAVVLGIGLPLAVVAVPFWYPPYALNNIIVNRLRLDDTEMATHKLGITMVLMPLAWLAWVLIFFAVGLGVIGSGQAALTLATVGAVALLLLGWVLYGWSGRWDKVKQDSALFLRVMGHPGHQDRLADQRRELVAEFDDVVERMSPNA